MTKEEPKDQHLTTTTQTENPDTSELVALLRRFDSDVETFHIYLDGFANGGTEELTGNRTRYALRSALAESAKTRRRIDEYCKKEEARLQGYVTATMRHTIAEALRRQEVLWNVIDDLSSDGQHHFKSSERQHVHLLHDVLRENLRNLANQLDALDEYDAATEA